MKLNGTSCHQTVLPVIYDVWRQTDTNTWLYASYLHHIAEVTHENDTSSINLPTMGLLTVPFHTKVSVGPRILEGHAKYNLIVIGNFSHVPPITLNTSSLTYQLEDSNLESLDKLSQRLDHQKTKVE